MLNSFQQWLSQPYAPNMSAKGWFAMVGLILISLMLWGMVLRRLEAA